MPIIGFFLIVLIVVMFSGSAHAQGLRLEEPQEAGAVEIEGEEALEGGYNALQGRDYSTAYNVFQTLALAGNLAAQYELGRLYHRGMGVQANPERAAYWYAKAAEQDNVEAQYRLGNMYMMGDGVTQSDDEAMRWYERAVEQGHDEARKNLATLRKIVKQAGG